MITRDIPRGRTMCRGALRIILGLFEERHASRLSRWLEGQAPSILLLKDQTLKRHWDQRCRCDSYPDRVRKGGRERDRQWCTDVRECSIIQVYTETKRDFYGEVELRSAQGSASG